MDNHPGALLEHAGKKPAIETDGGEQIQFKFLLPDVIGQSQDATAGRGGTANTVDQDVEATEPLESVLDDLIGSRSRRAIGLNESFAITAFGDRSRRGEYRRSALEQAIDGCFANAPGATGHEHAFTPELVSVV